MKRMVFTVFLSIFFISAIAYAEIGASLKRFSQSKFYKSFGFSMDTSVDAGVFSTTPGKEKIIFLSKDRRYTIELTVDKISENVSASELNYQFSDKAEDAERNQKGALLFFNEATAAKIDEKMFVKLYQDAKNQEGVVQKKVSGGFFISVAVLHHALYKEWNILIKEEGK